jgi:hypothetical protein
LINKIAILFLFFSSLAFSAEQAFFRPLSRTTIELKEGDSFNGVIELWNIKNISAEMINEVKGKSFLDSFYVVSLERPRWSENNPEVVLIQGIFILQTDLKTDEKIWTLGGLKIPVKIKEMRTTSLLKKNEKFLIMDGQYSFDDSKNNWKMITASLTALFITFYLVFLYRKKKATTVVENKKTDWNLKIIEAKTREDFLFLYVNRHTWLKLEDMNAVEFGKLCNDFLFKKEIQDYELDQLIVIKNSLSKAMK